MQNALPTLYIIVVLAIDRKCRQVQVPRRNNSHSRMNDLPCNVWLSTMSPFSDTREVTTDVLVLPDRPRLKPSVNPFLGDEREVRMTLQGHANGINTVSC